MVSNDNGEYSIPPLVSLSTGVGSYLVVDDVDRMNNAAVEAQGYVCLRP